VEHLSFPNESHEYRTARNALLDAEIALRRQIEAVAAQRRALPPGGKVLEDYVFERIGADERPEQVRLSELFGKHPSILLYSFMYGPERDKPCPRLHAHARRLGWQRLPRRSAFPELHRSQIADCASPGPRTQARLA
jgi:predicted dithiol-disulfide oxidoreductase (DUF899 family)